MSFLIDLFKKAKKGDAFRPIEVPDKYNDRIAALNAGGQSSQTNTKITTSNLAKISNGFIPNDSNLGTLPSA